MDKSLGQCFEKGRDKWEEWPHACRMLHVAVRQPLPIEQKLSPASRSAGDGHAFISQAPNEGDGKHHACQKQRRHISPYGVNHRGHGGPCVGEYDSHRGLSAPKDTVLVASGRLQKLDEYRHRAPHQETEEKDRELALRGILLHEFPFRRTDQAMPRVAEPILT